MKTLFALLIVLLFAEVPAFAQDSLQDVQYDDNGRFAVQVEAWRSEVKAQQRVSYWKGEGFEHASFAEDGLQDTGEVWYRVFLGRFSTLENAKQLQEIFAGRYDTPTWVTTTSGPAEPITTASGD